MIETEIKILALSKIPGMGKQSLNQFLYSHKVFEMFDGEEVRVKLECRNDLMKYVIDRFGMKFEAEPATNETTYCYVDVCLSPTFYGWVFGFGGDIKIREPETAVENIIAMSKKMLSEEA